jgi:5-methylcytosine-specific restriction protein A
MALKQTCRRPGCLTAVPFGTSWCSYHAPLEAERLADYERSRQRTRATPSPEKRQAARLYGTARWQELRLAQLRAEPLCDKCADRNRVTAATVVDHVERHGNDERRFYDPRNLQSLCKTCHDRKTMTEDRAARNRARDGW